MRLRIRSQGKVNPEKGFIGARAYRTTNQSVANTAWAVITLPDGESYDTDTFHDTVTNPSRMTVPGTGYYYALGSVSYENNTTGERFLRFKKNGTAISTEGWTWTKMDDVSTNGSAVQAQDVFYLAAGDYIEIETYQNSGAARNVISAFLTIVKQ